MHVVNSSPKPEIAKQQLVMQARLGDQAAFAGLVELYQTAVYNLCYRMLGEAAGAEDAAQETFVRAYTQFQRYDLARPFKTWLFAIACHHCIDLLRKGRKGWVSIAEEPAPGQPVLPDPLPGPEELALQGEQSAIMQAMLAALPPRDRSTIVARYWHDLSYEEIAEVTGDTVGAVKSRLHRARLTLAKMMNSGTERRSKAPHAVHLAHDRRIGAQPSREVRMAASL